MDILTTQNELIIRPTGNMHSNWAVYDFSNLDEKIAYQPGIRGGWFFSEFPGFAKGDNVYPSGRGDGNISGDGLIKRLGEEIAEDQGWWMDDPHDIWGPTIEVNSLNYINVYALGGIRNIGGIGSGIWVTVGQRNDSTHIDAFTVSGIMYFNHKANPLIDAYVGGIDTTSWGKLTLPRPTGFYLVDLSHTYYVKFGSIVNDIYNNPAQVINFDAVYIGLAQTKEYEYLPCYLRSESSGSVNDNIPIYMYNSRTNTNYVTKRHEYIIRPITSGRFDSPTALWTGQLDANSVNESILAVPGSGAGTYGWYSNSYPTRGDGLYISATTNDDLNYTTFTMQTPTISGYPKRAYLWILGGFHSTAGTPNNLNFLFAPSGGGTAYNSVVNLPNTVDPITNSDYNFSLWSKHSIVIPTSNSGIHTHINPTISFQPLWNNTGPFDSLRIDSFYISYEFDNETLEYLPLYMNAIGSQTLGVDLYLENEVRDSIPIFISGAPNVTSIPLSIFGATTTQTSRNMFLQAMSTSGSFQIPMSVRGSTIGNTFELQPPGSSGLNLFLKTATGTGINYNRDLFLYNDETFIRLGEARNLFLQVDSANSVYNGIGIYLGNNVSGINNYIPLHLYSNQFNSDLETSEGFYPLYDSRDMFLGQYQLELYVPMILQGQPIPISGGIDMIMVGAQPFNSGINLVMPVTYDAQTKRLNLFTHGY